MSLTSFIKIPKIKNKFASTFSFTPPVLKGKIMASPQTHNYSLIGTAFDYLLRFHIEQLNRNSITRPWIAEDAIELTKSKPDIYQKLKVIIDGTKKIHAAFQQTGKLTDSLLASSIILAKIDLIYRIGRLEPKLLDFEDKDIVDLKNLISVADLSFFKSEKISLLNPTFGTASLLVGGADADLIIDDVLIDLKTTKNLKFSREYFDQMIGYYVLSKIGGIDGVPEHKIKKISIYFSRYGILHSIPISAFENNPKFPSFVKWFKDEAKNVF